MMNPRSEALAHINLDAIAHNWRIYRDLGRSEAGAVVKADGCGLGAGPIARRLFEEGCRTFFVATLDEGLALRASLPSEPASAIYLFNGLPLVDPGKLAAARLSPVLNTLKQIDRWAAARAENWPGAAVHIDTGMNRLGLEASEVSALLERPELLAQAGVDVVMSHLACGDEPEHPLNRRQLSRFREAWAAIAPHAPGARASFGNSAGALLGPDYRFDLLRPGIALYGLSPFVRGLAPAGAPEPNVVLTLTTPLIQVRNALPGESVGYGAAHEIATPTRIGIVALGYADGFLRAAGGRGYGVLAGARAPIVGRVSMDLICLDVTAAGDAAAPGTSVEMLGPNARLDDASEAAGTIGYEFLTRLGPRCRRVYSNGASS